MEDWEEISKDEYMQDKENYEYKTELELVNKDLYSIMRYCRNNNVISNITINSYRMKDTDYEMLAKLAGAVAVSCYDFDSCFNCVQKLYDAGLKQVNIHQLFSNETYDKCIELINLVKTDERLVNLNAVVFLWHKPVGDRNTFTSVKDKEMYSQFVTKLIDSEIRFGFDSCSCNNFLTTLKDKYPDRYEQIAPMCEPCESSLFSYYIDVTGHCFPCSFSANYIEGIDLKTVESFADIWNNYITQEFREKLLENKRACPLFDLEMM